MKDERSDLGIELGTDPGTVARFTTSSHPRTARLFLPLIGADESICSWSELCARAGLQLSPTTRWSQLSQALPADLVEQLELPYGWLAPPTTERLVRALTAATTTAESCFFSLWFHDQYAGAGVGLADYPPQLEALSGPFDGMALHSGPLTWLSDRMRPHPWWHHNLMPVFTMPADGAFLLGCPIYHDSIYISSGSDLLEALRAEGFDILDIGRDETLPSESR